MPFKQIGKPPPNTTEVQCKMFQNTKSDFTDFDHLLLLLSEQSLGSSGGDVCTLVKSYTNPRDSTHPEESALKPDDTHGRNYSHSYYSDSEVIF